MGAQSDAGEPEAVASEVAVSNCGSSSESGSRPAWVPLAEVDVTVELARRLVRSQHPDLYELPLRFEVNGWDNVMFRLGDELALRMPRRSLAAPLITHEQTWLASLAPRLPLPVPTPVRTGEPEHGYPWRWSVVPWFPGRPLAQTAAGPGQAAVMGGFLRALHEPAPPNAPLNPYRGGPLHGRAAAVEERLQRLSDAGWPHGADARGVWNAALAVAPATRRVWLHGDLHPGNVLVDGDQLSAIIDWGDMTGGDAATDLAAAWMLFPPGALGEFREAYGSIDAATWERARGWALHFGLMLLDAGFADKTGMHAAGWRILRALSDPTSFGL